MKKKTVDRAKKDKVNNYILFGLGLHVIVKD